MGTAFAASAPAGNRGRQEKATEITPLTKVTPNPDGLRRFRLCVLTAQKVVSGPRSFCNINFVTGWG